METAGVLLVMGTEEGWKAKYAESGVNDSYRINMIYSEANTLIRPLMSGIRIISD